LNDFDCFACTIDGECEVLEDTKCNGDCGFFKTHEQHIEDIYNSLGKCIKNGKAEIQITTNLNALQRAIRKKAHYDVFRKKER